MALAAAIEERLAFMAPARQLRLRLAVRAVELHACRRDLRVLDAGCGDGLVALAIARRHPDWSVLGVDVREDLLAGARERAGARSLPNVRFEQADLTRPLRESAFDVVLALECLTEISDDMQALRTLSAAVSPGGRVVLHVPDRDWRPVLSGSPPTWREEVRHGYTADELVAALRHAGLEPVEVRATFRGIAATAQELRDRIKDRRLVVRLLAFPAMVAAVRLELWGVTWDPALAHLAVARPALDHRR